MSGALAGRRIVVPESRELDLFVSMLERAGAEALRCPLVSIHDSEDTAAIEAWLRRLVSGAFDDLVLYTGEGLRRLLGFARRAGLEADAIAALGRTRRIVRGPKPSRVLRTIGLGPDIAAAPPTTEGLVAAFAGLPMAGRRVGIQLYPECPDTILRAVEAQGASVDAVLPYRYASQDEDGQVVETLNAMAAGEIDAIALTSSPQVRRLVAVAKDRDMQATLALACMPGAGLGRRAGHRRGRDGGRLAHRRDARDEFPPEAVRRRDRGRPGGPERERGGSDRRQGLRTVTLIAQVEVDR